MPDCAEAKAHFVSRNEGGGWQGGGWTMKISAPEACMSTWKDALVVKPGCQTEGRNISCYLTYNDQREGVEIQMDNLKEVTVYSWSIT